MPQDAYIDDDLVESIEAIQDLLDIPTFREASQVYDQMARESKVGDIVKQYREKHGRQPDGQEPAVDDPFAEAERRLDQMEKEMEDALPGM